MTLHFSVTLLLLNNQIHKMPTDEWFSLYIKGMFIHKIRTNYADFAADFILQLIHSIIGTIGVDLSEISVWILKGSCRAL